MSRYIDADAFIQDICNSIEEMTAIGIMVDAEYLWAKMHDALDSAPTIELDTEAEQIARRIATIIENEQDMRVILSQPRCRECIHWNPNFKGDARPCSVMFGKEMYADDYCSYGERSSE